MGNLAELKQTPKQKTIVEYLVDPRVKSGIGAVATRYLDAERMLRLCLNAIKRTPKLAQCDPQTVLGALMTSAALGLEPNTVLGQAFLIPYTRRVKEMDDSGKQIWKSRLECQFQIGYRGFVTLAYRVPAVHVLHAEAIHRNDRFRHVTGSRELLEFEKALAERGPLIGAFCYTRLAHGEATTVLPLEEIHKIRARSETYRSLLRAVDEAGTDKEKDDALRKLAETPWMLWEDDMSAKSATKKHAKQLPLGSGDALAVAAHIDSAVEQGTFDLAAMVDPEMVRAVIGQEAPPPALPKTAQGGNGKIEEAALIAQCEAEIARAADNDACDAAADAIGNVADVKERERLFGRLEAKRREIGGERA